VFRCNPAPVCVLDEVDAPLDDTNVERFCLLLNDMVRETGTRFIMVTHHYLTTARMDRLYGVTMQERGVSRLLSVDLQRAAELADLQPMAAEQARRRERRALPSNFNATQSLPRGKSGAASLRSAGQELFGLSIRNL
jgi:energy-coupling factor transporter ATP-binding protein EcfA2